MTTTQLDLDLGAEEHQETRSFLVDRTAQVEYHVSHGYDDPYIFNSDELELAEDKYAKMEPDEWDAVSLTKHVKEVTTLEFVTQLRIK